MPTFARIERLKSRKAIGGLFQGGHSYVAYPFRVVWRPATIVVPEHGAALPKYAHPADIPVQMMVSVSKRTFKKAVERNLLKRRTREAYRLHKAELYEKLAVSGRHISMMLQYIAKEPLAFAEMEAGILKMIRKFPAEPAAS